MTDWSNSDTTALNAMIDRVNSCERQARLYLAAPTLLKACHAIFDHYDEDDLLAGDIEKLRAAIAKAEGSE